MTYLFSTAMSTVTGDLGIPEQAQHIKSVEEMEAYRWGSPWQRTNRDEQFEGTWIFKGNEIITTDCFYRLWSFYSAKLYVHFNFRQQMLAKTKAEMAEAISAPVFKTNLKDIISKENGFAHFEARLEPIGDPTLKVEWLKDGRPMEASE